MNCEFMVLERSATMQTWHSNSSLLLPTGDLTPAAADLDTGKPQRRAHALTKTSTNTKHAYPTTYNSPGSRLPFTANIFAVTPAVKPSTCLEYCSTCLELRRVSNLLGSCGSLNSRCHSSSGSSGCLEAVRAAFSALRFCCQAVILACSRASERW